MIRQKSFEKRQPTLYLVATPIGNQAEITQRALDVLSQVDRIAAEDTRHTGQLMKGYGISKPYLSHHEHNARTSVPKILDCLKNGESVALVSDAGYPLLSDPGNSLVKETIEAGFPVVPISGAHAATNALVASGLDTSHYLFYGFLSAKSSARIKELEAVQNFPYTMIFYEAPHRIEAMLTDLMQVFGDRTICLGREITKLHEEFIYGTISEVLTICSQCKGEMVVVVEGYQPDTTIDWDDLVHQVQQLSASMKPKAAAGQVAESAGVSKNELYQKYLEKKKQALD